MREDMLATVEAIHAAGLDAAAWPRALAAIQHAIGGRMASVEAFDRRTLQHREFLVHGMPPAGEIEYLDHYAAMNLRLPPLVTKKVGDIIHDYAILDAATMSRAPFYAEFLPRIGLRYFIAGTIANSAAEFAAVTVQRSAGQGHVGEDEIALMRRLLPHVRQAFDVARRIKGVTDASLDFEHALDWLADGVALIGPNGTVLFANEALQAIARRDDGIKLRKGSIDFAAAEQRGRFDTALAFAAGLNHGDVRAPVASDFTAPRASGRDPYLVSVRPLLDSSRARRATRAIAIVFVRDPLAPSAAAVGALCELFGLTDAEANLAQALQCGTTVTDYARIRGLSLNTVYTHLRRLREKTGSSRLPELIHKLNEFRLPARPE
jgi:DNA-binding CsgD family transcriptional regulator